MAMAIMYYALVQLTVSLSIPPAPKGHECDLVPSEAYWHVVVMNSGELPGLLAACALLDVIGRKGTLALLSFLTAVFSLLLIFDGSAEGGKFLQDLDPMVFSHSNLECIVPFATWLLRYSTTLMWLLR